MSPINYLMLIFLEKFIPPGNTIHCILQKEQLKMLRCPHNNDINYRRFLNDNENEIPEPKIFKNLLDVEFNKQVKSKELNQTFIQYFQNIIDKSKDGIRVHPKTGKPLHPNNIETYVTTIKHLQNYENTLRRPLKFDDIVCRKRPRAN